jgi:exosortase A-associated hydrolase 2
MTASAEIRSFQPFFLDTTTGARFCLFHPAAGPVRGAVLYIHPFAEEMNKARRMAAIQSRMLAARGYAVVQLDLHGCGDSDGDFREATWESWKRDIDRAEAWLRERVDAPVWLWGLRLGALLALDHARPGFERYAGFLLWQPAVSGESHLTQFLRMRVATEAMSGGDRTTTHELRAALKQGTTVEIAGYDLAPRLAADIDAMKLQALAPDGAPVYWLEVAPEASAVLAPPSQRVVQAWAERGVDVTARIVTGPPFWSAVEIVDAPELFTATLDMLAGVPA